MSNNKQIYTYLQLTPFYKTYFWHWTTYDSIHLSPNVLHSDICQVFKCLKSANFRIGIEGLNFTHTKLVQICLKCYWKAIKRIEKLNYQELVSVSEKTGQSYRRYMKLDKETK